MRILLVDDDPALRTLLRTTFEVADVDVSEADGFDAARRRIRSARPDVIVLDVHMPGTTGLEFCEQRGLDTWRLYLLACRGSLELARGEWDAAAELAELRAAVQAARGGT